MVIMDQKDIMVLTGTLVLVVERVVMLLTVALALEVQQVIVRISQTLMFLCICQLLILIDQV